MSNCCKLMNKNVTIAFATKKIRIRKHIYNSASKQSEGPHSPLVVKEEQQKSVTFAYCYTIKYLRKRMFKRFIMFIKVR